MGETRFLFTRAVGIKPHVDVSIKVERGDETRKKNTHTHVV